ncbi:MAG: aspartate carbamoyltransferase catalytic subunit [Candidatus Sumerlaeota bacterium]|nr:aspartate carbamoyltransferase catalytic subunit [Candidatus Sumerlaeota bacterium]
MKTPTEAQARAAAHSTAAPTPFQRKHLLGLEDLTREEVLRILDEARGMKDIFTRTVKKVPALRGKTVANLFFENSTRTRTSFELAAKRLSADVINFSAAGSSVSKGESLIDTVRTIEAMGADFVVMRHSASGAPHLLSRNVKSAVINAGDGTHEHPTQGLLDMFTMREKLGRLEGLKVAIVGDILHSRVARSNIWGLRKLGVGELRLVGPRTLLPKWFESMGCQLHYNLEEGIRGVDVINILRIQLERQSENLFPSIREYQVLYGLTTKRIAAACPDALIMHPGPINRGVEISQEVADGPQSVINEQVTNGVAIRMAVLYLLSGYRGGPLSEDE